jgi:Protein of unknown function (DUF1516)
MTHAHITSWFIAIILFFIAVSSQRSGSSKARIMQMVLRLFYIFTVITGVLLLHSISSISTLYIIKTIVGLWLIGAMEMVLSGMKKGKSTKAAWIQWIVALVLVLFLGLTLPLGFDLF